MSEQEKEQYSLYYAKNQSLALDIEILLKTLLQSKGDKEARGSYERERSVPIVRRDERAKGS